jgi:apolipoprotein N-acyltransferase
LFLAAGVLFVGAERLQGFFLGGFFWRFLAHSQYNNIALIQISDIFGAAGLSFLIAMVNGLLAELIITARRRTVLTAVNVTKTLVVCAAVIAAIAYGRWRISQEPDVTESGPLVAALQSNVPQSVKRSFRAEKEIFSDLMEPSKAAAAAGAQLIVWPETMVQANLDTEIWPFLARAEDIKESADFDKALRDHAYATAYLLIGSYGAAIQYDSLGEMSLLRYNSAFLYKPDGLQDPRRYDKMHLVMFGEYLPFRKSFHPLYNLLMKFTPYNYDYSLDAGTEYTVFDMTVPLAGSASNQTKTYLFGVIICYEDTIPVIARRFTLDKQGKKRVDWLVNISNDGWFVQFEDNKQKVTTSAELAQHAAICAFRAVENRLPIIRSTNTGISCLIDSMGRIHDGYIASSPYLTAEAMNRKGIAGWFVDKMPIDKRMTFFSKHGQWLDNCCAIGLALLIIVPLSAGFVNCKILKTRRVTHLSGHKK